MKKLLIVILAMSVLHPTAAWAGTAEIEASLTPESRFYWFDRMAEKLQLLLTLDGEAKAGVLSKIGLERLAEAESVENTATIGRLISDYLDNEKEASELAGDAPGAVKKKILKAAARATKRLEKRAAKFDKPTFATVADRVRAMTSKHLRVLERRIENAPEAAVPALRRAREKSSHGNSTAPAAVGKRVSGPDSSETVEGAEDLDEQDQAETGRGRRGKGRGRH